MTDIIIGLYFYCSVTAAKSLIFMLTYTNSRQYLKTGLQKSPRPLLFAMNFKDCSWNWFMAWNCRLFLYLFHYSHVRYARKEAQILTRGVAQKHALHTISCSKVQETFSPETISKLHSTTSRGNSVIYYWMECKAFSVYTQKGKMQTIFQEVNILP